MSSKAVALQRILQNAKAQTSVDYQNLGFLLICAV